MTPHFTLEELTRTDTGIDNSPDSATFEYRLKQLAMNMEHVRAILGGRALHITSAYRNEAVNKAVGGARNSHHKQAYAVDFWTSAADVWHVVDTLSKSWIPFDQLINEQDRGVTHISFAPPLRREVLTAYGRSYVSGNIKERQ